jgi:1,4-dihydroxy-6-naphthoate synthase
MDHSKTQPGGQGERIRVAFSPDSDDAFMFWALLSGKVDAEGLKFVAERADTEALNARAGAADIDVVAVSIARWPAIARDYLLLPHGMSVGRGYGPVLVAASGYRGDRESLEAARIAVPGLNTTACLILRLLLPRFEAVVVPISPYGRVFQAVREREVEAALVIHEGRLTYEREGMARLLDIGEEWQALTGLPLPLGGNAIRRGLGSERIANVSRLCRASIAWALAHRETVMDALLVEESRPEVGLDRATLDRYLGMYANEDSLDAGADVRAAIDEMYTRAHAAGLLDRPIRAEFAQK